MKVAISFLKSKYNINKTLDLICETNADYIHVDIMDGNFVKNKTLQYNDLKDFLKNRKIPLDIHLMEKDPIDSIINYKNLKPEFITIHKEIEHNIDYLIDLIHSYDIKAGISIKPNTEVFEIIPYLEKIDNILVMSVEPGKGGQKFIDESTNKVNELIKLRKENNYNYVISIDGGINSETISKVKNVDFVISGSFICMNDNYQNKIDELKKL